MTPPPNGLSSWARFVRDLGFPIAVASILLYFVLSRSPTREDITALRMSLTENLSGLREMQGKVLENQTRIIELVKETKK